MTSTGIAYSVLGISNVDVQHVTKLLSLFLCQGGCTVVGGLAFLRKAMTGPGDSVEVSMSSLKASFSQVKQFCGSCVVSSDRQSHVFK